MATAKATKQTLATATTEVAVAKEESTKKAFGIFIKSPKVQQSILSTLGDVTRAKTFTASIISAVTTTPTLMACDNVTILSAALLGESLNLSPSPQLGQYYITPFKGKATFVLGWKGYYQLALRSGEYKKLNAVPIKEGELITCNPIYEDYEFDYINDPSKRLAAPTIGYYAFYETVNGFRKEMYITKQEMEAHASRYSNAYNYDKKHGTSNSQWTTGFDDMALKTMYRQLIGKYGIMSTELQKAYTNDMSSGGLDEGTREYIDNVPEN